MEKTSKWYNPEWPDYYCENCGVLYQFYVNGKCSDCRRDERLKMAAILAKNKQIAKPAKRNKIKKETVIKSSGNRKGIVI